MNAIKLIITKNGSEMTSFTCPQGKNEVVVGRADGVDIKLDDRAVGRNHALIQFAPGGAVSIQKKSEFGKMQVNGSDVSESQLKMGDVISIANYQLRLEANGSSPSLTTPSEASVSNTQAESLPEFDSPQPTAPAEASGTMIIQNTNPSADESSDQPIFSDDQPDVQSTTDSSESLPEPDALEPPSFDSAPDSGERTAMISVSHIVVALTFKPGEANVVEYKITKEETSVGRGSGCDIIIEDKKSSRKHCIIKRIGGSYVLKDLGSANGTYVNGIKVSEQELAGEDAIKIGTTEFIFKATNQDYFAQESQGAFLQTTDEDAQEEPSADLGMSLPALDAPVSELNSVQPQTMDLSAYLPPQSPGSQYAGGVTNNIPGVTPATKTSDKKGVAKILEGFKSLPVKKKILYVAAAVALAYGLDDLLSPPAPQNKSKQELSKSNDPRMQAFLKLPKEKREFIEQTYTLAMDYYTKGKYELSIFECDKIIEILPDGYKDILDIKAYADQGRKQLEAQAEDEKRKKAEEERKQTILSLVSEAESYYNKGMEKEAKEVFNRILELDPENPTVAKLKNAIEERERAKQEEANRLRQLEAMRDAMRGVIAEGKVLVTRGMYYEAIDKFNSIGEKGADPALLKEASDLVLSTEAELSEKRTPLVEEGNRAFDAKEYEKARNAFFEALRIDPKCQECKQGIARVKRDVHERAQKIYIEAIISESVSDLNGAKKKYLECFLSSVPEDEYYGRCWRRYHRFTTVESATESATDAEGKPLRAPASTLEDDAYTTEVLEFL